MRAADNIVENHSLPVQLQRCQNMKIMHWFSQSVSSAHISHKNKDWQRVQRVTTITTWITSRHLLRLLFCHHINEVLQYNTTTTLHTNQAYSEYKHSLTFRVRQSVVTATKPVHRLQICQIVHNYGVPLPFPQVTSGPCSTVDMWWGTDRHTHTDGRDHYTFRVIYDSCKM